MNRFPKALALAVFLPWALLFFSCAVHAETCTSPSPTYPTFNPSDKASQITLSGGNLTATATGADYYGARTTVSKSTEKLYFEIVVNTMASEVGIGVSNATAGVSSVLNDSGSRGIYFFARGQFFTSTGSSQSTWTSFGAGDHIGIAVDLGNKKIYIAKNNTWMNAANPVVGTGGESFSAGGPYYPTAMVKGNGSSSSSLTIKFNSASFSYSAPSGFQAWFDPGPLTCTGKFVCSAASSSSCSSWVEAAGENASTFEEIGLDGSAIATAFAAGLGITLVFVFVGFSFGSIEKILSAVLGGRSGA